MTEVLGLILFVISFGLIIFIDAIFYGFAKYPERTKWFYKLPLGGIIAFFRFKKNIKEVK